LYLESIRLTRVHARAPAIKRLTKRANNLSTTFVKSILPSTHPQARHQPLILLKFSTQIGSLQDSPFLPSSSSLDFQFEFEFDLRSIFGGGGVGWVLFCPERRLRCVIYLLCCVALCYVIALLKDGHFERRWMGGWVGVCMYVCMYCWFDSFCLSGWGKGKGKGWSKGWGMSMSI
jgi:hypothetical protein